jgi:hypothetical protein
VTSGVVSAVFAGLEDEMVGSLDMAAGGSPATVLVSSWKPGNCKSRRKRGFAARVRDRGLMLSGGCVERRAGGLP